MTPEPLSNNERRRLLSHAEADLLWLLIDDRYKRAVSALMDSELQAAIVRSQRPEGGRKTEGSTAWSDPTAAAALTEASTEVRANAIRKVWIWEGEAVAEAVSKVLRYISEPCPHNPTGPRSTAMAIAWLTIAPQNRIWEARADEGDELAEMDHAIRFASQRAAALRQGHDLTTTGGQRVPSVFAVLEAARLVRKIPVEPEPVQKPMEGCVSCKRNNGHFTAIDTNNHSARSMCRVCGDYFSGEHVMLPLDAVKYMHRTGKKLTWKIIEEAKRAERAS